LRAALARELLQILINAGSFQGFPDRSPHWNSIATAFRCFVIDLNRKRWQEPVKKRPRELKKLADFSRNCSAQIMLKAKSMKATPATISSSENFASAIGSPVKARGDQRSRKVGSMG
jgi:hypothetical protein